MLTCPSCHLPINIENPSPSVVICVIEVEIRARLKEPQKLVEDLNKRGAKSLGTLKQSDYMYAFEKPGEPIKEGGILVRIREENGKTRLEFKEVSRETGAGIDILSAGVCGC